MGGRIRTFAGVALAALLAGTVLAQPAATTERPLTDTRLAVSTLVREDLFAGFIDGDLTTMARGEANLEKLLEMRPDQKALVRVWQAGAYLTRAIKAREAGRTSEYTSYLARANAAYDEANSLNSKDITVPAVGGGVGVLFADKLAPADRPAMWARTYAYFQTVTTSQTAVAERLPPHLRGESYGGLVTSAQRTGHDAEAAAALDKMLVLVKDTPYEADALKWKADPKLAPTLNLACKNCHDAGRLAPTRARLDAPKV